jgi:hypothetical protein
VTKLAVSGQLLVAALGQIPMAANSAQQELHRCYEPVRRPTLDRYSVPHGSAARDAPSHLTIEAVPGQAFSRSMQKQ